MSFLDSVLTSIETGKPSPIPTTSPAPSLTISSSTTKSEARKPNTAARPVTPVTVERKNGVPAGTKRKAEEPLARVQKPAPSQGPTKPAPVKRVNSNTPAVSNARPIAPLKSLKPPMSNTAPAPQKNTPVSTKPPPKGSFAEIMAKAKALQQTAPTQVGMFKHQSAPKEKLSKMERKKRIEAQAKEKDPKQAKRPGAAASTAASSKPGSTKVAPKREREEPTYRGTARPPPPQPEYRGTAGLPSRNGERRGHHRSNKRSRMDEYLGTDEEDEGEYANDYDDYYSESSDMEAGLDDVEEEEAAALVAARREDIEDMRAEAAAKQEKLERRNRLAMLASKRH
ncbi:hypothetical protein BJY00DRAFT_281791 [Aspergillus carlsbadensis]|nr:hypothetical protein BJY00DRAFT_281791 [Aspergillus carlsbadensis]